MIVVVVVGVAAICLWIHDIAHYRHLAPRATRIQSRHGIDLEIPVGAALNPAVCRDYLDWVNQL